MDEINREVDGIKSRSTQSSNQAGDEPYSVDEPAIIHPAPDVAATADIRAYQMDVARANARARDTSTYTGHSQLLQELLSRKAVREPIVQPSEAEAEEEIMRYNESVAHSNREAFALRRQQVQAHQAGTTAGVMVDEMMSAAASALGSKKIDSAATQSTSDASSSNHSSAAVGGQAESKTTETKDKAPKPSTPRYGVDDSGDWSFSLLSPQPRQESRWVECPIDLGRTQAE